MKLALPSVQRNCIICQLNSNCVDQRIYQIVAKLIYIIYVAKQKGSFICVSSIFPFFMTLKFCQHLGGKEGVLVVWQLDTGKKKFLPRIGSPLLYFTESPDPSLSSVSSICVQELENVFHSFFSVVQNLKFIKFLLT